MIRAAGFWVGLLTSPALACPGTVLFDCPIDAGAKRLTACLTADGVTYAFGRSGAAPELELNRPLDQIDYVPWNGVGRSLYESLTFRNKGYGYHVWSSVDRLDLEQPLTGGVVVFRGEKDLARLDCDVGQVEAAIDLLFEAKTSVGYCWDFANRLWSKDCTDG